MGLKRSLQHSAFGDNIYAAMEIFLGFDPGGKEQFAWAVCSEDGERLRILHVGSADHAPGVLTAVKNQLPSGAKVMGAGIDAPLFWVSDGRRNADQIVRKAIIKFGAKNPGGTVQQLNSLRGACLVQGPLIAKALVEEFPSIAINETHPKALLFMLGLANKQTPPRAISVGDLCKYVQPDTGKYSEHERDSVLGALSTWASLRHQDQWRNLVKEEEDLLVPFDYKPSYWMPWNIL